MREIMYLKQGDTGRSIEIQCKGSDGRVQDLTGATAAFRMTPVGSAVPKINNAPAVIADDPTTGRVRYDWTALDVDTPGDFDVEVIATINGKPVTFPTGPKPDDYIRVVIQPRA